jgi:predicted permease
MSCQWSWITSSILERNEVNKVLMAVSHLTAGATFLTYQMTRSCRRPLIRHPSHPNRGSPEAIHPNPSFIRIATFEGIVSYLMGSYGDNHAVYIYIYVCIYILYIGYMNYSYNMFKATSSPRTLSTHVFWHLSILFLCFPHLWDPFSGLDTHGIGSYLKNRMTIPSISPETSYKSLK